MFSSYRALSHLAFAFSLLLAMPFAVQVADAQTIPAKMPAQTTLRDEANTAIMRGRIVDADGVAVSGARVAVLWPGDLRDAKSLVQSDANGKFELDNLRAGELLIGAARGRDWGQIKASIGGEIEIKLAGAAPQPMPQDHALALEVLEQWFAKEDQKNDSNWINYAAQLAAIDPNSEPQLAAMVGADSKAGFEGNLERARAKSDPARAIATARVEVDKTPEGDAHQTKMFDLATLLVQSGDLQGAREVYNSVAPSIAVSPGVDPQQAVWDAYKYAQLAGIAGAIENPNADYWLEILDRSLERMSADDRLFRIGSYAGTLAQTDASSASNWLDTRTSAEQVRCYEEVIPVVAAHDLPRARQMLAKMEELVARGDVPIEPTRNDGMYRPTPASSLNAARIAIVKALLPTDPREAYEQSKKLTDDDRYGTEELQLEAAVRLPAEEALPILRAQFAENKESAAMMARVAKLAAPFDAQLSEQWFGLARQKLADHQIWDDESDEMAAYAFYRADSDPPQSRLLLENNWQRILATKFNNPLVEAAILRPIEWAMVPVDWERAQQMSREIKAMPSEQPLDNRRTQHDLLTWLLALEQERHEIDFERPSIGLLE